jgi:hypothetical protein
MSNPAAINNFAAKGMRLEKKPTIAKTIGTVPKNA